MAVQIDPISKTISLGVRDLVEEAGFARIGFDRDGWTSFAIGSAVHQQVLTARIAADSTYRKEIYVQGTIAIEDWTATITGRIDGCRTDADGSHLEEFKTASMLQQDLKRTGPVFQRHRRQLLLYCDLWTRLGHRVASARLVYVDPVDADESPVDVAYDGVRQSADTEMRLRCLLSEWRAREESRSHKAAFAQNLPFPHEAPRLGQRPLIEGVQATLNAGGHLLAEAPTGSGKTAASLHPALQHTLRTGRQLFFLTSKTLQQQMAVRVLTMMNPEGAFRSIQIRAKERMCANDRVLCHEDACPYARDFPAKMERSRLLDRLVAEGRHHPPTEVFKEAEAEEVCPFEVQLLLARRADAVVADYNYAFDPGAALGHFRDEGLGQAVLVIDEAHNLPDRVRAIFSPELLETNLRDALEAARRLTAPAAKPRQARKRASPPSVLEQLDFSELRKEAGAGAPDLANALEEALALMHQLAAKALPDDEDGAAEIEAPYDALRTLSQSWEPRFGEYVSWKRARGVATAVDPIVDFHFALLRLLSVLRLNQRKPVGGSSSCAKSQAGEGFTTIVERRQGTLRLAILCLDPSLPAAAIFREASSIVCLSATLRPFEMFRRSMGLESHRTTTLSLPSSFPPEHRRILILPQVRTTFAARARSFPKIAVLISEIDASHHGNKLILFPSYDFLRRVAQLLPADATGDAASPAGCPREARPLSQRLRIQPAHSTDAERQAMLHSLADPPEGGIVLMVVLGGMFAEGVDYPGTLLETVIVVSPGLPQVGFERELLRRYYDEHGDNGFEYAYLQPGMTRVIQAVGRLIRTETDRGVIGLVCERFLEAPYTAWLPRDWYHESPLELVSHDPAADIRKFWGLVPREK